VYRCEEPSDAAATASARLTPAEGVRARQVDRDILVEPLGLRMTVPAHWQPTLPTVPWVAVTPKALEAVAAQLRYHASDPVFPVSARLLETTLPLGALVAFLAPEAYETGPGASGDIEHGFWGTVVMVFALRESAPEALAALEPALGSHARAVSCPRDVEAHYFPYRKDPAKSWIDWDFSKPWTRWRDVEAPWRRLGAAASWHAHGHHRSNRVDLRVRQFEGATVVVAYSTAGEPKIAVDPDALLPVAAPRDPPGQRRAVAPAGRCVLPPKGHIHWAIR
jgi:hypothetical protein